MNKYLMVFRSKLLYFKKGNKKVVDEELKLSQEGSRYEDFKDFLKDCPKYQVESGYVASQIRNIFRSFGATYQQFVFIDKSASKDKAVFLRRDGDIVLHDEGTYCLPWDTEKDIIYFDVHDMRPLIDKTNEMDWQNPDTCADVITSITNSKSMAGMNGQGSGQVIIVLCVLIAITLILVGVTLYTEMDNHKKVIAMIQTLNNSILR